MRRTFLALAPAVAFAATCCSVATAAAKTPPAKPLRMSLSVPARMATGSQAYIEALIVNTDDNPRTFAYEARAAQLNIEPNTLKRRVWLGAKAFLLVEWQAKPAKPGDAKFVLLLDGKKTTERGVRVLSPVKPPVLTKVEPLGARPLVVDGAKLPAKCGFEVEITAGAPGELAATLHGLRQVSGLDTNAIVARGIVPAALAKGAAPELDVLYALQDGSGGWGATPLAAPDIRTTSWVVFWLGHLAKSGVKVDAKALNAAIAHLRSRLPAASVAMRVRALTALAANGKAEKKDLAAISKAELGKLPMAGRLLAGYAGAEAAAPPKKDWDKLNAFEASVLLLHLTRRARLDETALAEAESVLSTAVARRGAQPGFNTHEAALYALALKALADRSKAGPEGTVSVTVDGRKVKEAKLDAASPVLRCKVTSAPPATGDQKVRLSVSSTAGKGMFCRVIVRPAE